MTEQTPMDLMKCCPIDNTFKIIGKKFTIHILRNMVILNQHRFNQFIDSIEGINPNTLSTRLKEMDHLGFTKYATEDDFLDDFFEFGDCFGTK